MYVYLHEMYIYIYIFVVCMQYWDLRWVYNGHVMGEQKQLAFGLNSHVLSLVLSKVIWADEQVVWVLQRANS